MTIKYRSTRGEQHGLTFEQVVLGGLAIDKGLYVPESIPQLLPQDIESMRGMNYVELAFTIISKFIYPEDIPTKDLRDIIQKSFASFRHKEVIPTVQLSKFWILELFHGPTFAFKDVALQFLGNLFEFFLTRGKYQKTITILGATSGDTGSAAIHGLRGKKNINCFIMYPDGKVTEIQERQMTSILDENIQCICIKGDFDDAQAIVKAAFADERFRNEVKLGAINSINWARVLAQITYYFYSYLQVTDNHPNKAEKMIFAVPTGNFGDILAGYYAKRMGLPIEKLVVCTNENDVLHRFFETGSYTKKPATLSIAPSMDISISSNFERYLFYIANENSELLASWMNEFESTGNVTLPDHLLFMARTDFSSASSSKVEIIETMREIFVKENYLLCPHTATSVVALKKLGLSNNTVCLATAHPAKFEEAVDLALNGLKRPERPPELQQLFIMPTRSTPLPKQLVKVEEFVKQKIDSKSKKDNRNSNLNSNSNMFPVLISLVAVAMIGVFTFIRSKK